MRDVIRDVLADVLPLIISSILGYAVVLVRRGLSISADSAAGQAINRAAERAAAVVYQRAVAGGVPLSDETAIARMVGEATMTAEERVGAAMARQGVESRHLYEMVRADFARWVASDPSITGPKIQAKE